MKVQDLRNQSAEELKAELLKVREEQFRLRMQHSTGQLSQTHLLKEAQRNIARIKTVLTEKAGS
jgi:large subunit ribosomal protein L29